MLAPLILLYHSVSENADHRIAPDIVVSPAHFEQQLRYLSSRMRIISLSDLVNALRQNRKRPSKTVVITFDDGYRDNFTTAYPLLQRYNLPATFFLATGFVGTSEIKWEDRLNYILNATYCSEIRIEHAALPGRAISLSLAGARERARAAACLSARLDRLSARAREQVIDHVRELAGIAAEQMRGDVMLNWDEVRKMAEVPNFTFGCHTVSHERLSMLPDEQVSREILESRQTIESELGSDVRFFAYPYGTRKDFDDRAIRTLRDGGFDGAVTTIYKRNGPRSNLFMLGRVLGADTIGAKFSVGTAVRASFAGKLILWASHCLHTRFV